MSIKFSRLIFGGLVIFSLVILSRAQSMGQSSECGTVIPVSQIELERSRQESVSVSSVTSSHILYVPVATHMLHRDDSTGGADDQHVMQAMSDLNTYFEQANIRFFRYRDVEEKPLVYHIYNDYYFTNSNSFAIDSLVKTTSIPKVINIWFSSTLGTCGKATFSSEPQQWILMYTACTGEPSRSSAISHHMGHFLDLYHTHETAFGSECPDGSNCSASGDLLCDTPADPDLSGEVDSSCVYSGVPTPMPSCGATAYAPALNNIMSNSQRFCRDAFSPQQIEKMRLTLVNERPELFSYDTLDSDGDGVFNVADNCPEIVNPDQADIDIDGIGDNCMRSQIEVDIELGPTPLEVNFSGMSDTTVSSWFWEFGDGASATSQLALHTYSDPGLYQIRLTAETPVGSFTAVKVVPLVVYADTLIVEDVDITGPSIIDIDIYANNTFPVRQIQIPFTWAGPFDINFLSWSTAGLRTDYFTRKQLTFIDFVGKRAVVSLLTSHFDEIPHLPPDSGAVLTLRFEIESTNDSDMNQIEIVSVSGRQVIFATEWGSYTPFVISGSITSGLFCGDVNGSQSINVSDATFVIAMIFSGGPQPDPLEIADVNSSGSVNIADATFLIAYIFSGGEAPNCPF